MKKLNVLIAQEFLPYRKILQKAVEDTDFAQVRFMASTGQLALERLKQSRIDVVLLSIHVPEKFHLETLSTIKNDFPGIHVIMVSDMDKVNAAATVQALQMGAIDFIMMQPGTSLVNNITKTKNKLQGLFTQIMTTNYTTTTISTHDQAVKPTGAQMAPPTGQALKRNIMTEANLVVIAASTGGPAVLKHIFQNISGKLDVPILVVQHMPAEFTGKLAQSLNKDSPLPVTEAVDNIPINPGQVLLAPGGMHLTITKNNSICLTKLDDSPPVNGVKPSADVLFSTVSHVYSEKKVLAVILTGMGSDGLAGVKNLKQACECYCLVQSEQTCVVYGMPGSVVNAGLADEIQDLARLPERINAMASGRYSKW